MMKLVLDTQLSVYSLVSTDQPLPMRPGLCTEELLDIHLYSVREGIFLGWVDNAESKQPRVGGCRQIFSPGLFISS